MQRTFYMGAAVIAALTTTNAIELPSVETADMDIDTLFAELGAQAADGETKAETLINHWYAHVEP